MELIIVQLLIVAFLLAYLMGEETQVAKYPMLIITREVDSAPIEVWEAYWEKQVREEDALVASRKSQAWKWEIADGLEWSAERGPTPLL